MLSAIAVVIAPQYLSNGSLLGTNALEPQFVDGMRLLRDSRHQAGTAAKLVVGRRNIGIGLEEKYSIVIFVSGIVAGLLLAGPRRVFANRWIWVGGLAAFLIFLPNLLWNIRYDWPFLQLMRNIKLERRDAVLLPFESSSSKRFWSTLSQRLSGSQV